MQQRRDELILKEDKRMLAERREFHAPRARGVKEMASAQEMAQGNEGLIIILSFHE